VDINGGNATEAVLLGGILRSIVVIEADLGKIAIAYSEGRKGILLWGDKGCRGSRTRYIARVAIGDAYRGRNKILAEWMIAG